MQGLAAPTADRLTELRDQAAREDFTRLAQIVEEAPARTASITEQAEAIARSAIDVADGLLRPFPQARLVAGA